MNEQQRMTPERIAEIRGLFDHSFTDVHPVIREAIDELLAEVERLDSLIREHDRVAPNECYPLRALSAETVRSE